MSLSTFITERLKITSNSRSATVTVTPQSRDELRSIIEEELEHQGPDADLNFIDTSEITDMSELFYTLNIRNIKIDEWDVSNVTDMHGMFAWCKDFNCDLSGWDVSNVTNMADMFNSCKEFKCDLSDWNVSNVVKHFSIFFNCDKIPDSMIPKFNK